MRQSNLLLMEMPIFSLRLHWSFLLVNLVICISSFKLESHSSTPTFGNETDKLALLAFKNYVVDVPNGVLSSWNDSALLPVGGGYMQSPTSEGHSLEVGGSEISICHPSDIGHLPRMQHLNLSMNFIQGKIPIELTNCSSLRTVDFTRNNLTGQIPFHVGHMSKLQHLWLGAYYLRGVIPFTLGNLSSWLSIAYIWREIFHMN